MHSKSRTYKAVFFSKLLLPVAWEHNYWQPLWEKEKPTAVETFCTLIPKLESSVIQFTGLFEIKNIPVYMCVAVILQLWWRNMLNLFIYNVYISFLGLHRKKQTFLLAQL